MLLAGNVLVSAALVLVAALLVRRWLTMPLAALTGSVRAVAEGDVERHVVVTGPPELAGLGRDVEAMRRHIVDDLRVAVAAREALEQQAPAVALLRDRLAATRSPVPGAELAAVLLPAEGVLAGDWYDVLELCPGRIGLVVVDVSGHGTGAGVMALQSKGLLAAALRDGMAPGEALAWTAKHLGDTGEDFLTCFVATLSPVTGRGSYASAGHPDALVVSTGGVRTYGPTGPLLGPIPGTWESRELSLGSSDLLAVHTDGLVEARARDGTQFGTERLSSVLSEHRSGGHEPCWMPASTLCAPTARRGSSTTSRSSCWPYPVRRPVGAPLELQGVSRRS